MASYPSSAKSYTTKSAGDTIQPAHVNDLQDEVTALETALLTGGLAHPLFPSGTTQTLGTGAKPWGNVFIAATKYLYLDGGNDTGIVEDTGNRITLVTGGAGRFAVDGSGHAYINAAARLYFDGYGGGGNTYIHEASADLVQIVAGGNANLFVSGTLVGIPATIPFYLDGGNNTFIYEQSADVMDFVVGGGTKLRLAASAVDIYQNLVLPATIKLYLDGASNTYISESSADRISLVAGGTERLAVVTTGVILAALDRVYLDGGSNTFVYESAADTLSLVAGGTATFSVLATYALIGGGLAMSTWPTTASAANAYVADGGVLSRSTSSKRYKQDIEPLDLARAKAAILALQPVTYRGKSVGHDQVFIEGKTDKHKDRRHPGFLAEDVALADPLLVTLDDEDRPDYVTYDRIAAFLVPVVQDLERRLAALEGAV